MRAHEAALQLGPQLGGDVPGGQGAEAGGDAVVRLHVVGQRLDHRAGAADLGQRLRRQLDARAVPGDGDDVGERDGTGARRRRWPSAVRRCDGGVRGAHAIHSSARRGRGTPVGGRLCLGSETLQAMPNAAAAGQALAVLQLHRAAPRAGAGRRDRPRPRACPARASTTCWRCCAGEGFVDPPARGAPLRPGRRRVRAGLGVHPAGAAAADRPAGAGAPGRQRPRTTPTSPCCTGATCSTSSRSARPGGRRW